MSTRYCAPIASGLPKHLVESFAEDVAKHVEFSPGDSLEELVSLTGGQLVFGSSGSGDYESGSIIAKDLNDYTIYLSRNTSRQRDRFTIAHELGHLLLHLPKVKEADPNAIMRATRWVDETDEGQKRAEWEANWFAAAFLMPQDTFTHTFRQGGVSAAQHEFDVSPSAVQTRAKSLGLD
ncbi:MAG: ImmA/IrrE family metallo-endopeptidase [Agrobacterium fabrum]|uniref:ImmA/IrrE family metallo-endopeptidase n=1 Tax=Agrobacterium fabrum TaxID=1176649 RepID=A0A2W5GPY3_9HYPH|nr:MAG: ImmA/IrrE family metallo-endopeptidase [Agrobacterium fabrum]